MSYGGFSYEEVTFSDPSLAQYLEPSAEGDGVWMDVIDPGSGVMGVTIGEGMEWGSLSATSLLTVEDCHRGRSCALYAG
ncbi:hypothetical protein KKF84_10425 [Myxococcota bacterium]|nr:hypothetical protein [Myxococcota bacterium]